MKKTGWGALAVAAVVALGTTAEALQVSVAPAVQDEIAALIQSQVTDGKTPGIAISIAKDGRTIYENAAGVRDIASKAPMLVTTPQSIGSITKQFTAAAILLLQQQNKLSIDDKLSKYVPEYVHGDEVTLRQMLNMASGIPVDDLAIYGSLTEPIARRADVGEPEQAGADVETRHPHGLLQHQLQFAGADR